MGQQSPDVKSNFTQTHNKNKRTTMDKINIDYTTTLETKTTNYTFNKTLIELYTKLRKKYTSMDLIY